MTHSQSKRENMRQLEKSLREDGVISGETVGRVRGEAFIPHMEVKEALDPDSGLNPLPSERELLNEIAVALRGLRASVDGLRDDLVTALANHSQVLNR